MKKNDKEKMVEKIMEKFTFSYVDSIYEACPPSRRAEFAKYAYFKGFKVSKVRNDFFIEVTNPAKRVMALGYVRQIVRNSVWHSFDDEQEIRELAWLDGVEKEHYLYGSQYVDDVAEDRVKQLDAGYCGLRVVDLSYGFTGGSTDSEA